MKQCRECKEIYLITSEDRKFYQKISVPEPTLCPNCRQQRRYAWRNERTFYKRKCDLCQRKIISIYSSDKPYKVYCQDCWWSDKWDPLDYAREFNFHEPFFTQFKKLMLAVPRLALVSKNSENSEYANHSGNNKNVYLSSVVWYSENIYYSNWVSHSQDCVDCTYLLDTCELCYELITSSNCYICQYSNLLFNCCNCKFCYDMRGCENCLLCSNLRNQKYCIKNKQYSEKEYTQYVETCHGMSLQNQYNNLLSNNSIHRNIIDNSENCSGNNIFHAKNCQQCFDISNMENSKYAVSALDMKDSMDIYHCGYNCDLLYECHAMVGSHNCKFCHFSYHNYDLEYCDSCHNSHDLFGCVGIKRNNFCILNKPYSENDYKKIKTKIINQMLQTKEYGEFFPSALSPFGYSETVGQFYMPKDKIKDYHDKNNISQDLPRCQTCCRNFKFIKQELEFYKKMNISVPRYCPNCRYLARMHQRQPRKLSDHLVC